MTPTTPEDWQEKLWDTLESDRTVMLGLVDVPDAHPRPMTAQIDGDNGPIWFFTAKGNTLVDALSQGNEAIATFASKGHDLFATLHGRLVVDQNHAMIDKLWNRFVAAWYEGKDDPKLVLLRFDPERAEIWSDASSFVAGVKMLIGIDPKQDYRDKVAQIPLS